MVSRAMTEKDAFAAAFEREYQTTHNVLRAFPADKSELKPSEKLKPARELAWMLVLNQQVLIPTMQGTLQFGGLPAAPKSWNEILPAFEQSHRETMKHVQALDDEQMNRTLKMPTGPGKIADMRIGDALWFFLNDTIHHRGQFSVYMRMAGGRLPSIYGPTADEPWS